MAIPNRFVKLFSLIGKSKNLHNRYKKHYGNMYKELKRIYG